MKKRIKLLKNKKKLIVIKNQKKLNQKIKKILKTMIKMRT
jgi:hypothetical protein